MGIEWQYYPKSDRASEFMLKLVGAFDAHEHEISSSAHSHPSNHVLAILAADLRELGFRVEVGKKSTERIQVPVLFGRNGKMEKHFDADALHPDTGTLLEIEAGRGVTNNQFLKDFFQACVMYNVSYFAVAVRKLYRKNKDFEALNTFFDVLYASGRLTLPLKGILIIGY